MGGALATRVGLKRGRGRGNASRRLAMPSLLWQEAQSFYPRLGCCSSSVVEHSLGKGEVESSILSGSTTSTPEIASFAPTRRNRFGTKKLRKTEQDRAIRAVCS